ncbi:RNA polymerase II-associated protein [Dendrothele bispora CBS 962.96]|uniref:RNA polymerase II-associated protein n=1 Tax=Dendrothele bispora (strain CBS 962.96) TaxID=1314807 RepID=A0A4S8M115_DENBC|nr:RNA polymerase II-associated protein [Dendrothele bispora CBS 962.96]
MDDESQSTGRNFEIELGGQEVISIDLDQIDPNPNDVLDVLREGQCRVWVWTKLAGEYWRRGYLEAAAKIANTAIECFRMNDSTASLPPVYSMLANIQIAHARKAPKLVLQNAREDILHERTKDEYYREAAHQLNTGEKTANETGEQVRSVELAFLTRGIQQLATRELDDAMQSFQTVLSEKPTNVIALLGKARILYARRQYAQALQIFQLVLRYNPNCQPDPRIGIGLCLWALDKKDKAKMAWQRSLELNPSEWSAQLLLGLEAINASKDERQTEEERTRLLFTGSKYLERAFNANNRNASAANALCEIFIQKGNSKRALKLAERTIQFADTLTLLTEGYVRAGRICHSENNNSLAVRHFQSAAEGQPKHVLAAIGLAQMRMVNDEMAGAIHTLDTLIQSPNPQKSTEATVMLASLRAFPRPGVSGSDIAQERIRARELFDRVTKALELDDAKLNGQGPSRASRTIGEDVGMHVELARLWQDENLDKTAKALREALRISEALGKVDSRLLNNLGALHHLEDKFADARSFYEKALTASMSDPSEGSDATSTSILYNLARVYEDQGEDAMAQDAYDKLLSRHPEYIDAKIRQAQLLSNLNRNNDAHDLLKQALASQNGNLNLRAFYTHFLIQTNLPKIAKDFVWATLKDHDKYDVYSLCASGWIMYHQARESRETSSKGMEERKRNFTRSAEFYEKALQLDPQCAFAAQGLAIITAEDALGTLSGQPPAPGPDEAAKRMKYLREALDIFIRVRESISDGSVYLNMGHCYYSRDEFERAIESYLTASERYYNNKNVPTLLCLCRSHYAKAMKDQSYPSICTALNYAQKALHLHPNDKAVLYNIAMIQQKSAEMLFTLPCEKRTLKTLHHVIEQAQHAQRIFASLAADQSTLLPYSRDIADQRRKYGDNMLRRGEEHLSRQRDYEEEAKARLDEARQIRQQERDRLAAIERERTEELRKEAEKLAEQRKIAREQALEWTREARMDSDDEKEKKPKKSRKPKVEVVSGDEAEAPKRKRKGKIRKAGGDQGEGEEPGIFSDDEETEKPARKRPKKKVVKDEEDEGVEATGPQRKKQFKSREVLSDTDDEMEG